MDERAFDAAFARHEAAVRGQLLAVVKDPSAVEDLLQEAFLRLWTKGDQLRDPAALGGWLLRTAGNLALNHLRAVRRRRTQPLEPETGDEEGDLPGWLVDEAALSPDERLGQAEQQQRLRGLLDALPEAQREVVRLVHEQELSIQETADQLNVAPGTVKSRLYYARLALRGPVP